MHQVLKSHPFFKKMKKSFASFLFFVPVSLFSLLLILLLAYNGFSIFYLHLPVPSNSSPGILPGESSYRTPSRTSRLTNANLSSSPSSTLMFTVKEENPPNVFKTNSSLVSETNLSTMTSHASPGLVKPNTRSLQGKRKRIPVLKTVTMRKDPRSFTAKVKDFLALSSCKLRFFMTWISSLESFGDRELFAVESLFKSHPAGCLILVSESLDSEKGKNLILSPFLDKGFKVTAIKPDFDHIFRKTPAQIWYDNLRSGKVHPGDIPIEQNLSNLLRLVLLYRFGGIYLDTDFIILKSFSRLRNVIGAQAIDYTTRNWSRLNNAVLIFNKKHPLLNEFIEEFAATFNGNRWGHNGPYLVSRVVTRVGGVQDRFNFTVLPPPAFYPVDWNRIGSFFRAPANETVSKWLRNKIEYVRKQSFAVHLWNRQSKNLRIETGSIIQRLLLDSCVFCNSSTYSRL